MGGFLGFGITPGGDGIRTPIGNIYARGSGGRRAAAARYWAGQEEQKQQAKMQGLYDYLARQADNGVPTSVSGSPGDMARETANGRYNDSDWLTENVKRGVLTGNVDLGAAYAHSDLFTPNSFLSPAQINAGTAEKGIASRESMHAQDLAYQKVNDQKQRDFLTGKYEQDHTNDMELARLRTESARDITDRNSATAQQNNESAFFQQVMGSFDSQITAILGKSIAAKEDPARVAALRAQKKVFREGWARGLGLEELIASLQDTGGDGQITGSGGQDTGRLFPTDGGSGGQTTGNASEKTDFIPKRLDGDAFKGMNEAQQVSYLLDLAMQGHFIDRQDIPEAIRGQLIQAIEEARQVGTYR